MQLANTQGIQVFTINKDNLNAIMPSLQIRSEIKTDIANAINAEREIIVPQQEISVNDWRGLGYLAMNQLTGEAAYIISGGFAGGDSTIPLTTFIKAKALSVNVSVNQEISYIESSVERDSEWFPGADNEFGTTDDVRLFTAIEYSVSQPVWSPPNTRCESISGSFYAPHFDIAAPLLEIAGMTDKKLTPNLTVGNMVINSGSGSYGRISRGFVSTLDDYIQLLKDKNMTPTISSAYRTWYHNCELRPTGCCESGQTTGCNQSIPKCAATTSNHMDGIAADVVVVGTSQNMSLALDFAKEMFALGGVGKYSNRVHVDFGGYRRW